MSPDVLRLVLFDVDEVLASDDHAVRIEVLAKRSGASMAAVASALFASGLECEADLGRWQPHDYAAERSSRLGAPLTLADCIAARAASTQPNTAVLALAHRVARRARVAILTNSGPLLVQHLQQICPAMLPLFAGNVFGSCDFGVAKPDPAIFFGCLARLEVDSSDTLFVDDRQVNVDGARVAGLDALRFTDADALARAFADRHPLGSPHDAP